MIADEREKKWHSLCKQSEDVISELYNLAYSSGRLEPGMNSQNLTKIFELLRNEHFIYPFALNQVVTEELVIQKSTNPPINLLLSQYFENVIYSLDAILNINKELNVIVLNLAKKIDSTIKNSDPPYIKFAIKDLQNIRKELTAIKAEDPKFTNTLIASLFAQSQIEAIKESDIKLTQKLVIISNAEDPLLHLIPEFIEAQLSESKSLIDLDLNLDSHVSKNSIISRIAEFVEKNWDNNINSARFFKESKTHQGKNFIITESLLDDWLKEANGFLHKDLIEKLEHLQLYLGQSIKANQWVKKHNVVNGENQRNNQMGRNLSILNKNLKALALIEESPRPKNEIDKLLRECYEAKSLTNQDMDKIKQKYTKLDTTLIQQKIDAGYLPDEEIQIYSEAKTTLREFINDCENSPWGKSYNLLSGFNSAKEILRKFDKVSQINSSNQIVQTINLEKNNPLVLKAVWVRLGHFSIKELVDGEWINKIWLDQLKNLLESRFNKLQRKKDIDIVQKSIGESYPKYQQSQEIAKTLVDFKYQLHAINADRVINELYHVYPQLSIPIRSLNHENLMYWNDFLPDLCKKWKKSFVYWKETRESSSEISKDKIKVFWINPGVASFESVPIDYEETLLDFVDREQQIIIDRLDREEEDNTILIEKFRKKIDQFVYDLSILGRFKKASNCSYSYKKMHPKSNDSLLDFQNEIWGNFKNSSKRLQEKKLESYAELRKDVRNTEIYIKKILAFLSIPNSQLVDELDSFESILMNYGKLMHSLSQESSDPNTKRQLRLEFKEWKDEINKSKIGKYHDSLKTEQFRALEIKFQNIKDALYNELAENLSNFKERYLFDFYSPELITSFWEKIKTFHRKQGGDLISLEKVLKAEHKVRTKMEGLLPRMRVCDSQWADDLKYELAFYASRHLETGFEKLPSESWPKYARIVNPLRNAFGITYKEILNGKYKNYFSENLKMIDDFNKEKLGLNNLKGKANFYGPGFVGKSIKLEEKKSGCLSLKYTISENMQWGGYYSVLPNNSQMFTEYEYISFEIKTTNGSENFRLGIIDSNSSDERPFTTETITEIIGAPIGANWRVITVPLSNFSTSSGPSEIDRSQLKKIILRFDTDDFADGHHSGTIYIDNLMFLK